MRAWEVEISNGLPPDHQCAGHIISTAAKDLVGLYTGAIDRVQCDLSKKPFILTGGVFNHNPRFRMLVADLLHSHGYLEGEPIAHNSPCAMRPALGALMFALGDSTSEELKLPSEDIVEKLIKDQNNWPDLKND